MADSGAMVSATTHRREEEGEEQPAKACAAPEEKEQTEQQMAAPSEGRTVRGRCSCVRPPPPCSYFHTLPLTVGSLPELRKPLPYQRCPCIRCTYELGPVIGKGNDGQVMRAVNLETGKRVAIKIMRRRCNPDDDMSEASSRTWCVPPKFTDHCAFRVTT